ncbi:hypothetical protein NKI34_27415 [Mesorhizobium sp. M0700]|uniref:hypothetical protein n=1 Tax=Mesorhizobium sp. M0700 TaxID=2956988 RepID=UPI00333900E8
MFKLDLPHALNDEENDISAAMRRLLGDLYADLSRVEERIRQVTNEIEAIADREDIARFRRFAWETCPELRFPFVGRGIADTMLAASISVRPTPLARARRRPSSFLPHFPVRERRSKEPVH